MKVIVVLADDKVWEVSTPVAVVDTVEQAEKVIKSYEDDPDYSYRYRTVEYIK